MASEVHDALWDSKRVNTISGLDTLGPPHRIPASAMRADERLHRFSRVVLVAVLLLAVGIRLFRLDGPITDRHNNKQIHNAIRITHLRDHPFAIKDIPMPVFEPGSLTPWIDETEVPLYHTLAALVWRLTGDLVVGARLVSIAFVLLGMYYIFQFARRSWDLPTALWSTAWFSLWPAMLFYGRAVITEVPMVSSTVAAVYFFDRWIDERRSTLLVGATVWGLLAGTFKPPGLLILGVWLFRAYQAWGWRGLRRPALLLACVTVLLPATLWLPHLILSPYIGPPDLLWHPRFYLTLAANAVVLVLSPIGIILCAIQLARGRGTRHRLLVAWLLFASGWWLMIRIAARHDYYLLTAVPPAAILAGIAASDWTRRRAASRGIVLAIFAAASIAVPLPFFYAQDPILVPVAAHVRQLCRGPIVHWTNNPSHVFHLQFFANRVGWTTDTSEVEQLKLERYRQLGADCLVVTLREHHFSDVRRQLPRWIPDLLPYYYRLPGSISPQVRDFLASVKIHPSLRFFEVRRQEPPLLAHLAGRLVQTLVPPSITHTMAIVDLRTDATGIGR